MRLTPAQIEFIQTHAADDLNRLLLAAARYPEMDVPFLAEQIASRRQIKEKLPEWYANTALIFPAKIAAEQCSSEQTAKYKQLFVSDGAQTCDLTGGLGIDSFYLSRKSSKHIYIERFAGYCEAARSNFEALGAENIEIRNADSSLDPEQLPEADLFYIDPVRRGSGNKRLFALQDCEPDLSVLLPELLQKAPVVLAKLSPMVDLQQALSQLPGTTEVHVLAVRNECKELLFKIERGEELADPPVFCINFTTDNRMHAFRFTADAERNTPLQTTDAPENYLYEPNASILKAGAFKQVAAQYGLKKLHQHSHLYTSETKIEAFPGRIFRINSVIPFGGKQLKTLHKTWPQANITTRNFPLSVEELRKKLKIRDGGTVYLFATTLANQEKVLIECCKAD